MNESDSPGRQDRVVAVIRSRIEDGLLLPGQRLPAVRELAAELALDKGTVVRAIRRLVAMGLVRFEGGGQRPRAVVGGAAHAARSGEVVVVADASTLGPIDECRRVAIVAGLLAALHAVGRPLTTIPSSWLNPQCRQPAVLVVLEPLTPAQVQVVAAWQVDGTAVISGDELPELPGVDLVVHDHAAGGAALVQALHQAGKRRLLPIWGEHTQARWAGARRQGIEEAAGKLGVSLLPALALPSAGSQSQQEFEHEVRTLAGLAIGQFAGPDRADGVLAVSDGLVPVIAAVADRVGRQVHADLAITGYDGYWRSDPYQLFRPTPPLATVDKGNRTLGAEMARLALARLAGDRSPVQRVVLPPSVIAC